jgi:anaerobic magnesium-protoporphyrin IX monomethyl ester cyclase
VRVLLVNPPYIGWLNDIKVEPIGLLYIAAVLREQGHDVALYDPYIGDDARVLIDRVSAWRPDVLGIAVYTVSEQFCFDVARTVKELDPTVTIVAGGPHATFTAPRILRKCPHVDIVAHRESEETMLAIADARQGGAPLEGVPGISYRRPDGTVATNAYRPLQRELDALPFPARDMLSDAYYAKYRATGVITARGCAYRCDFCVSPAFFRGVRQRDIESVATELRETMEERAVRHVRFYDDVFAYNVDKLRRVKASIAPLGLTFDCYVRIDCTTREMLALLKDSGCVQIRFGVETGDDDRRKLRKGNRTASFARHAEVVAACRDLGIETLASYIVGFPGETRDDMMQTVEFADRLNTDQVGFYKLTPYPGTPYWNMLGDEDAIPLHNYTKFDNEVSVNEHVTSPEIFSILQQAYESYYRKRRIPYDRPDTLRFLTSLPKLRY